jgi:type VI secretion system protein ImpA
VAEVAFSAALDDDGTVAMPGSAAQIASPPLSAEAQIGMVAQPSMIDPAVALCVPLSEADPCGPDLDLAGDVDYLNFFAHTEGALPSSFFSSDDGKPFDRSSIDLPSLVDTIHPLWERSRDLRLLVMRARLLILNRDLGGFAVSMAAIAYWLDKFWNDVHPRGADGDFSARVAALEALDLPTVVFPLQYAPLCEVNRIGAISYRAWMIAEGEVKPRPGEQKQQSAALTGAVAHASLDVLAATRAHVAMLKTSLVRIRESSLLQGSPIGLQTLSALVDKLQGFIDPHAALLDKTAAEAATGDDIASPANDPGAATAIRPPTSLADAQHALAAIADYYNRSEPSSPALPLIRQAHQLIGKSFFDVMSILVPTQLDKAAFQIGVDQFFELPLGKLPKPSAGSSPSSDGAGEAGSRSGAPQYRIESRNQAIELLEQVQRFFRHAEPSSPVPMLCERARALAERNFMDVLREVLPKAALKTFGADK